MKSIAILGRQPALGLIELESLYGAAKLQPINSHATLIDFDVNQIQFERLGGSIKLCRILYRLETSKWHDSIKYLNSNIPNHLRYLPAGSKLQLGLSAYGFDVSAREVENAGLGLKKIIKSHGQSVRLVPNKDPALNSAQVLHNRLTGPTGWELVLLHDKNSVYLAQTVYVQDIESYGARDQVRPKRDAKIGMLPPKLAQIIINLTEAPVNTTILDPFCGTGVILQEAQLMGYEAYGTDIDERMVAYTRANITWLQSVFHPLGMSWRIDQGDATQTEWRYPFAAIASETYLGRPFSHQPDAETLKKVISDVDYIHRKFLKNVTRQTKPGFRLALALPAWRMASGFKHLRTLDSLGELGYTRASFVHASGDELIYHRQGQIVGRELVVLIRK